MYPLIKIRVYSLFKRIIKIHITFCSSEEHLIFFPLRPLKQQYKLQIKSTPLLPSPSCSSSIRGRFFSPSSDGEAVASAFPPSSGTDVEFAFDSRCCSCSEGCCWGASDSKSSNLRLRSEGTGLASAVTTCSSAMGTRFSQDWRHCVSLISLYPEVKRNAGVRDSTRETNESGRNDCGGCRDTIDSTKTDISESGLDFRVT